MASLNDFLEWDIEKELVIGTYIYPYVIFSGFNPEDPYTATEIISEISISDEKIFITRNGGLFSRPPEELVGIINDQDLSRNHLNKKLQYKDNFTDLSNRIICELCLFGIISEPITPVHVSSGSLVENHAVIMAGSGGREQYLLRTLSPFMHLYQPAWYLYREIDSEILNKVIKFEYTKELIEISENLPILIASAYSHFSTQQVGEALINSWIVVEQIIDKLWEEFTEKVNSSSRARRLKDTRTYTSSIRIEILYLIGAINSREYEIFQMARHHRNQLAHRASISLDWANESMTAMKYAIEHLISDTVAEPYTSRSVTW
ncbi:MAG TPA: hypothetical protein DCK95_11895 [Anaerolineaceae bacterium]|nr:hypothetical protein [Anaerolineaceae bacterium]